MADVAETHPAEAKLEDKVEKTETAADGANGEIIQAVTEKANETAAEKSDEKPAEKSDEKLAEQNGGGERTERREHNDRKRRGSFNGDRGGRGGRGRGDFNKRGRGNYNGSRVNNNKSHYEDLPESSDADEIRHQVDFYFSDSNLPLDRFLMGLTGGHENHPVPLKTIHDFKRMRHFQPFSAVRDAVAASKYLDLNNQDEITRKKPLDEKYTSDLEKNRELLAPDQEARSVYVKGFGEEKPRTQLDIEAFFEPYGPISSVRLRRAYPDKFFKGSVFVEFADKDLQKQFLELDPKPTYEDRELKIMSKSEYIDGKNEDIREGKVKAGSPNRQRHNGGSRNFDRDDWKGRRDHDQRNDRGRGRGRGRGNGRGGRGGRHHGRDRSRSGSPNDRFGRDRSRKDDKKEDVPSRVEAEAAKAGAEGGESKKRAREDDGDGEKGEAKKPKEEVAATES